MRHLRVARGWRQTEVSVATTTSCYSQVSRCWQGVEALKSTVQLMCFVSLARLVYDVTHVNFRWLFSRRMLQMGGSRHWQDAMEAITGQRNIDAAPLVEYFKPILDWLIEENASYDVTWDESACATIMQSSSTASAAMSKQHCLVTLLLLMCCLNLFARQHI